MGIGYNPKIATNGLILCLDPGNTKSYPGSGNTWSDLSGNGNNLTMQGTLSFSSGAFTSTATISNYWGINPFNHPTTAVTVEMWALANSGSSSDGFWSYASTASDNNNLLYDQTNLGIYGPTGFVATNISIADGVWRQLVRTSNRTSGAEILYINGQSVFSTTVLSGTNFTAGGSLILGQEQDSVGGSLDPNQALEGKYAIFRMYNRVLSAAEVSQNFQALRGRFGI